jgi:hypothetical protein
VGAWGPAGFFWVNMFYSWSVHHYIIVFGFWLKCCRYAQLVEWFIWFTGGNGWSSKFGAHWLWTAKRSWQTATWLPCWDQDNWVGAAAQLYWQGYTLVWGWLPVFWGGWSVQLSFAGWK